MFILNVKITKAKIKITFLNSAQEGTSLTGNVQKKAIIAYADVYGYVKCIATK